MFGLPTRCVSVAGALLEEQLWQEEEEEGQSTGAAHGARQGGGCAAPEQGCGPVLLLLGSRDDVTSKPVAGRYVHASICMYEPHGLGALGDTAISGTLLIYYGTFA